MYTPAPGDCSLPLWLAPLLGWSLVGVDGHSPPPVCCDSFPIRGCFPNAPVSLVPAIIRSRDIYRSRSIESWFFLDLYLYTSGFDKHPESETGCPDSKDTDNTSKNLFADLDSDNKHPDLDLCCRWRQESILWKFTKCHQAKQAENRSAPKRSQRPASVQSQEISGTFCSTSSTWAAIQKKNCVNKVMWIAWIKKWCVHQVFSKEMTTGWFCGTSTCPSFHRRMKQWSTKAWNGMKRSVMLCETNQEM